MEKKNNYTAVLESVAVGLLGALAFLLLHFPLPWMLGPLFAVMAWRLALGRRLKWPVQLRKSAMILFGYMLGTSFTGEAANQMMSQLPFMIGATVLTAMFGLVLGVGVSQMTQTDMTSSLFGSVPGGLSQIVLITAEMESVDRTVVTFMQTIRVTSVIFLVPFLTVHGIGSHENPGSSIASGSLESTVPLVHYFIYAGAALTGAWLGRHLRLPASSLTGPLLLTAVLSGSGLEAPHLPSAIIIGAQLSLGIHLGLQMKPLENVKKLMLYTAASCFLIVLFSLILAFLLTMWTGMDLPTAFLSTAPGGIAEMGMTAMLVHADLSMVSAYQLFRIFFIMFAVIPFLQWWTRRDEKKSPGNLR